MRTLLISATLLALAGAAPAMAQSYSHAISSYDDRQDDRLDSRYDDRQGPVDPRSQAYDGRGVASGGDYRGQDAYSQESYRPAPRRHHRRAKAAVSRYTASGRPVYYDDGMIRTGRDFPAGTVGGTR